MTLNPMIGLWNPHPQLSSAVLGATKRAPLFTIMVNSADPCAYDVTIDGWRQPWPMQPGQSTVEINFTITNLTGKDSVGTVTGSVGGSPLGAAVMTVKAGGQATGKLTLFGGAAQGTWPLVLRYDLAMAEVINPAVGIAGPGVPLTKTLYETVAAVEQTYIAEPWLILETDYVNPPYSTFDPQWSTKRVGSKVFMENDDPRFEWVPVLVPDDWYDKYSGVECEFSNDVLVGASGAVTLASRSTADLPFTHAFANDPDSPVQLAYGNFGLDFTFDMIPDPHYWRLLGPSIRDTYGTGFLPGPLHVEMDQGLLPVEYRPGTGDRVAVFGRWIIDAGHDDFGAEIHPPLLIAAARPGQYSSGTPNLDKTTSTILGRPYLLSQIFSYDSGKARGLRAHLTNEMYLAGILSKYGIDIKANILPGWSGFSVEMSYILRPPSIRRHNSDKLFMDFRFTVRNGVAAYVLNQGDDSIRVVVKIDGTVFQPAQVPPPGEHQVRIRVEDLPARGAELKQKLNDYIDSNTQNNPAGRLAVHNAVDKGANAVWYDAPLPTSQFDNNVRVNVAVDELPKNGDSIVINDVSNGMINDNDQPFPIYGFVNLYWRRASGLSSLGALSPATPGAS